MVLYDILRIKNGMLLCSGNFIVFLCSTYIKIIAYLFKIAFWQKIIFEETDMKSEQVGCLLKVIGQ